MKIAIISDIHSNIYALKAVLSDIQRINVEGIYCLGDIVGYGPNPSECLKEVVSVCQKIVRGNHEDAVANPEREKELGRWAREGVKYSRNNLPTDVIGLIGKLPQVIKIPEIDMVLCHGSYTDPSDWKYIDRPSVAAEEIKQTPLRICVVGHTHNPFVFGSEKGLYEEIEDEMELEKSQKFIINVGSVGQPRDGDCRASYGIFDIKDDMARFTLRRVFYDIGATEELFKKANISSFLSERLFRGQ